MEVHAERREGGEEGENDTCIYAFTSPKIVLSRKRPLVLLFVECIVELPAMKKRKQIKIMNIYFRMI